MMSYNTVYRLQTVYSVDVAYIRVPSIYMFYKSWSYHVLKLRIICGMLITRWLAGCHNSSANESLVSQSELCYWGGFFQLR